MSLQSLAQRVLVTAAGLLSACEGSDPWVAASDVSVAELAKLESGADGHLSGLRAYRWATYEPSEALAVRFPLHFSDETKCDVSVAGGSQRDTAGPNFETFQENGQGFGMDVYGTGTHVSFYAGPFDGRDFLYDGTRLRYHTVYARHFSSDDTYVLTHLVEGGVPSDLGPMPGAVLAVSIECDQNFDIVGAVIGSEATLFFPSNFAGTGVHGPADVTVDGIFDASTTGAASGFYMGRTAQNVAGNIELQHPGGLKQWSLAPNEFKLDQVESGPGHYKVRMDRVTANVGPHIWFAIYGFKGPLDLRTGFATLGNR